MMRILCVEDERMVARHIASLVEVILVDVEHHIDFAEDISTANEFLQTNNIDLLLLDLNLYGEDGFTLLSKLSAQNFNTVIISANTDKALKAFEYGVIDFVPKPFDQARLEQAFIRVKDNRTAGLGARYLWVKRAGQLQKVVVADIHFIKGAGSYSELYLHDGSILLHDKNLEKLLASLPASFIRIHKSYIVDQTKIAKINSYPGSKYQACLEGNTVLPIGRKIVAKLKDILKGEINK